MEYDRNTNPKNPANPSDQRDIYNTRQESTQRLNELIRGERSAVETYRQALEKVGADPRVRDLRPLAADHERAIRILADKVSAFGGQPSRDSGVWGTWAETVMGTAKIFGDRAALMALKEGEEHGLKEYEKVLGSDELDASCRSIIENQLLPQQREHVSTLDRILKTLN